jgi:hypothetical protein
MHKTLSLLKQGTLIAWASPWTLVGLAIGTVTVCTGGHVRRGPGILEFYGGAATWLLGRLPSDPFAMTLGHTVLGLTEAALDLAQPHELVHVRQYERWGPFFIPAYLGWWLALSLRGKDGYRDNPFEREAYDRKPEA